MGKILDNINNPDDLKKVGTEQLAQLAEEIRGLITESVSRTGGHLASNLGVVEMTIALHYVFDFRKDRLLWDVGHQCYAHKILTGRKDRFNTLRQQHGISGFPNPAESEYDVFAVGHAGTSIATALGMALGAEHNRTDEKIVAIVGDASIVNGASFEALNNMGLAKRQLLIVLNDNSMAIDVTQGAIAKFLSKVRLSNTYEDLRRTTNRILEYLPLVGKRMEDALENFKKTLRMTISPSRLFESLNIPYFGPVDGHDAASLIELFKGISHLNRPAILHVYTKKGKGFTPADDNPRVFHSTGPFEINGEIALRTKGKRTFTEAFSDAIVRLGGEDEKIVALTAAMPDGTGLVGFKEKYPDRYYDVGIAESAAVDIAAGLAKQGMKPFLCIYSTFLQRGFDQIFQEIALQNLPVVLCIDRGGFVGSDGPTHHGLMDIGYLRTLPNMTIVCPACESEMKGAMEFAARFNGPCAIRYPRDTVANGRLEDAMEGTKFEYGKGVTVRKGQSDIVIAAAGPVVSEVMKAADTLAEEGIDVTVLSARFAKPVDEEIIAAGEKNKKIITVEDHNRACGFGAAVMELASEMLRDGKIKNMPKIIILGGPDKFTQAAPRSEQIKQAGLDSENIVRAAKIINTNRR